MSNYFNSLPHRLKVQELGKCDFMNNTEFSEGVNKLKFGEKAVFFIPSNLGYGEQGAGDVVPPNANLIFEVELLNK